MRGYLAQRKKQTRIRRLLQTVILFSLAVSIGGFCSCSLGEWLDQYRLQVYLLLLATAVGAFIYRFFVYGALAVLLGVINFMAVSSAVNIWSAGDSGKGNPLAVVYQKQPDWPQATLQTAKRHNADVVAVSDVRRPEYSGEPPAEKDYFIPEGSEQSFIASVLPAETAGKITMPHQNTVIFSTIPARQGKIMLIAVDFSLLTREQTAEILPRLRNFIVSCNEPVIVVGDFNLTAWNQNFSKFLDDSGLEVKNSLLSDWRNWVMPPHFYVLGYKTMGVESQQTLPAGENKYPPYLTELKI